MLRRLRQVLRGDEDDVALNNDNVEKTEDWQTSPFKLKSTGYKRGDDGSVTLSVTLDKDQVECCVCLSSMTDMIFRCRAPGTICHNICVDCEWQIRRMKNANGHTKLPRCPMCKVEGNFYRHRALERQLFEISQPCKNSEKGCTKRFFPWDEGSQQEHLEVCMFEPVICPFCEQSVPGGRQNFVEHLRTEPMQKRHSSVPMDVDTETEQKTFTPANQQRQRPSLVMDTSEVLSQLPENDESSAATTTNDDEKTDEASQQMEVDANDLPTPGCCHRFHENKIAQDTQKNNFFVVPRDRNTFIVNYTYGLLLVFLAPTIAEPVWKVYTISISYRHELAGNNRAYLSYCDEKEVTKYTDVEQNVGLLGESLMRPIEKQLIVNVGRLTPSSFRQQFLEAKYGRKFLLRQEKIKNGLGSVTENNDDDDNKFDDANNGNSNESPNENSRIESDLMDTDPPHQSNPNSLNSSSISHQNNHSSSHSNNNNNNNSNAQNNSDANSGEELSLPPLPLSVNPSEDTTIHTDMISEEESVNLTGNMVLANEQFAHPFIAKNACTPIQVGTIYAGVRNSVCFHKSIHVRMFTLEDSLKVGAIVDARDFTGKWYQAEVIKVADQNCVESIILEDTDPLLVRKVRIHYLGYSANYDEWLHVDTDSHRVAQRGTYTVGPDLRAIRRHAQPSNPHQSIPVPPMLRNGNRLADLVAAAHANE